MTTAEHLVRRLRPTDYRDGQVLSKAFVELKYDGLSLHAAGPEILGDRAERYCAAARYGKDGDAMGACLVPIEGIQEHFEPTTIATEIEFGHLHHDLKPPPGDDTDPMAVDLATRASDAAALTGILREGKKKGNVVAYFLPEPEE